MHPDGASSVCPCRCDLWISLLMEMEWEDKGERLWSISSLPAFESDERNRYGLHPGFVIQDCLEGSCHYALTWPLKPHCSSDCSMFVCGCCSLFLFVFPLLYFYPVLLPFASPSRCPLKFLHFCDSSRHWAHVLLVTSCSPKCCAFLSFIYLSVRLNWQERFRIFTIFPFLFKSTVSPLFLSIL